MRNNYSEVCKKSQGPVNVGFKEALRRTMSRIDLQEFEPGDRALAYELIMIVAEAYCLYPSSSVKINGETRTAETVNEIYSRLTSDHLKLCIEKFRKIKYEIKYRKSYFRTALYNSVFEFESCFENALHREDWK